MAITMNSVSGGKTSAYIMMHFPADYEIFSLVCLDDTKCAPKDKAVIDYVNAKLSKYGYTQQYGEFIATAEDDRTLVALMDLEQYAGKEITWVRGKSYDQVIQERFERVLLGNRFRLPSWARRYCTEEMKLEPIFYWWFNRIGEKVDMRLGFRFDEFKRMERFFNNSDPTNFRIPVSRSMTGTMRAKHETFNWRNCQFPLIQHGITKEVIESYWQNNGRIRTLFLDKKIEFPVISNCIGCFHKKPETLMVQWHLNPEKMQWFANQEKKDMGTWLDSRITYEQIGEFAMQTEMVEELIRDGASCDSGGCHD